MDIIYTTNTDGQGAVFADRGVAEDVAQVWAALRGSETWGEFKAAMPPAEYANVLENLELANEEVDLDEAFDPEEVPGYADGDYPAWLASRALDWFPEEVVAQFGSTGASILNGDALELPAERADEIAEALRQARPGWTVTRTDLFFT